MDVAVEYVWRILQDTPWWVWVLFVYLVIRGIKAMRPATGPVWRFAIIPVVFLVWGISTLVHDFGLTGLSIGSYLVALAVGAAAGWLLMAPVPVRADRAHGLVAVPGGPATLILILVVFVVKYTFGVWQGMDPQVTGNTWFLLADCGLSGLVAGMFAGRFAHLWRKYRTAPGGGRGGAAGGRAGAGGHDHFLRIGGREGLFRRPSRRRVAARQRHHHVEWRYSYPVHLFGGVSRFWACPRHAAQDGGGPGSGAPWRALRVRSGNSA